MAISYLFFSSGGIFVDTDTCHGGMLTKNGGFIVFFKYIFFVFPFSYSIVEVMIFQFAG
jgi:hypothetical protein